MIKFETTNRAGNNLYLDNIKVFEGLVAPLIIRTTEILEFELYPNPTGSNINIHFKRYNSENSLVTIYNSLGEVILSSKIYSQQTLLQTESLSPGLYIIEVNQGVNSTKKSFVKWED